MFSETSGGEQLEQFMTWGVGVTKRERERSDHMGYVCISGDVCHNFCQFPNIPMNLLQLAVVKLSKDSVFPKLTCYSVPSSIIVEESFNYLDSQNAVVDQQYQYHLAPDQTHGI